MPSMHLELRPEMTTEQKVNLLFEFCEVFERDQEVLLRGMQTLLREEAERQALTKYLDERTGAIRRIRNAAGMAECADEKTDPGMNG